MVDINKSVVSGEDVTVRAGEHVALHGDSNTRRTGVGTNSPARTFHVRSGDTVIARFESSTAASPGIDIVGSGGSGTLGYNSATGQFTFETSLEATDSKLAVDVLSIPDGGASAARIEVGTGGDLKLYHDGTNSYVRNATGSLILQTGSTTALTVSSAQLVTCSKGLTVNTTAVSSALVVADGTGYVGAGIAPGVPLHVYHPTVDTVARFQSGDAFTQIQIQDSVGTATLAWVGSTGILTLDRGLEVQTASAFGSASLVIDQDDADEPFINYEGSSAASAAANISTWTTGATLTGYVRIAINGTDYWMPYYTAPTS